MPPKMRLDDLRQALIYGASGQFQTHPEEIVVAAAAVVAAQCPLGDAAMTSKLVPPMEFADELPQLRDWAGQALNQVLHGPDLAELWHDSGDGDSWTATIHGLKGILARPGTDEFLALQAPGWASLAAAQRAHYPEQSRVVRWLAETEGAPWTLRSVAAFRAAAPAWHWHYLTEGLTELFQTARQPNQAGRSGTGYELTFRLLDQAAADADAQPPSWPAQLLASIAEAAHADPERCAIGSRMLLGTPISEQSSLLDKLVFVADGTFGTIQTPWGEVGFRQVFGITGPEHDAGLRWSFTGLAELLERQFPQLITIPQRRDMMTDPGFVAAVEAATLRDGSSRQVLEVGSLSLLVGPPPVIEIAAEDVALVADLIRLRLGYGRELYLASRAGGEMELLTLLPAAQDAHDIENGTVELTEQTVGVLARTLLQIAGDYRVSGLPDLVWRVVE